MDTARNPRRLARWTVVLLLAVTFAGAGLRWTFLDHPMRYDESYNYLNYASRSPGYILTHYVPNNHVLHTLMAHGVSRVFGDSPMALRTPAFMAGVLLIPAAAWLAWCISSRHLAALLAALATAGSSSLIEYSANARGYSLLALCATLQAAVTVLLIRYPRSMRLWATWAVLGAMGVGTVPVMTLATAGSFVALALAVGRDHLSKLLTGGMLCGTLGAFLYCPILLSEGVGGLSATGDMAYGILRGQIAGFGAMLLAAGTLFTRHMPVFCLVGLAAGLVIYAAGSLGKTNPASKALVVTIAVAIAGAWMVRAPLPARAWLFALPVLFSCAATGLCLLVNPRLRPLPRVAVGGVVVAIFSTSGLPVLREARLCAEPGGLVEVEPALRECQRFGVERCAVISPYSPATAYYTRRLGISSLASPVSAERVYLVADAAHPLDTLWNAAVVGYETFGRPRRILDETPAAIYVTDRIEASALAR